MSVCVCMLYISAYNVLLSLTLNKAAWRYYSTDGSRPYLEATWRHYESTVPVLRHVWMPALTEKKNLCSFLLICFFLFCFVFSSLSLLWACLLLFFPLLPLSLVLLVFIYFLHVVCVA